jgi:DNA-directed RNA polymerase subunit RPC12/RpoP
MSTGEEITKGTAPVRYRCVECGGWVLPKERQTPMLRAACPCGGARVVGTAEAVQPRRKGASSE